MSEAAEGWAGPVLVLLAVPIEGWIGVEAAGQSLESVSKPIQSSLKGGSISASYIGQFSTPLTSNASNTSANIGSTGGGILSQTVSGQTQRLVMPVTANEATAAYVFHPKHIPLQPFVNLGGGAISFIPQSASNQWRAAGLVEAGLDLPTENKHLAIRIEGRSLVYRAPNFNQPAISTRSWRVTDEPAAGVVYRF